LIGIRIVSPSLLFPTKSSACLEVLCVISFCAGVLLLVTGLRRGRKPIDPAPPAGKPLPNPIRPSEPTAATPSRAVEIIRLSPDSTPVNAAAMTQQQKIVAALQKAPVSNSAGWASTEDGEEEWSRAQVATKAATIGEDVPDGAARSARVAKSGRKNALLWAGAALGLLSLYLFLRLRNAL
jgi:hypothetical protein